MKGFVYNGDATITKGCGSSYGERFFAVNDLVAFKATDYSSPDGNSHRHGCIPSKEKYLLQEEIFLEEFDNSTYPGPGVGPVGSLDVKKIKTMPDEFWCEFWTEREFLSFVLQVLESEENVFSGFIPGDISEVRNHPGKFLHIYNIPKGYWKCKKNTFADTVSAINLQKMQEDEAAEIIRRFEAGEKIGLEAMKNAYLYAFQGLTNRYEYFRLAQKAGLEITISVARANGHKETAETLLSWREAGVTDTDLKSVESGKDSCCNHHYYFKRSGWKNNFYLAAETYGLEAVRFLVLKSLTPESLKQHIAVEAEAERLRKEERKAFFNELTKSVTEKYGEEILKIALRKKGKIIATLQTLSSSVLGVEEIYKILSLTTEVSVIANLIEFVEKRVKPGKAEKTAECARAWAYLRAVFPDVAFSGCFDDALLALLIYAENWGSGQSPKSGNTLGDYWPL